MIPIRYVEPVYRPPSEAESLILPVTDGCSWNQCTFCEMYTAPQKKFRARDEDEVLESIRLTGQRYGADIRRVFLADGDALVLPTRRLLAILEAIRTHLPAVRRISSYCLPRNLRKKSQAEINELAAAGLKMVYVGAESGDDQVLAAVNKGETFETTREALDKLGAAGITRSVMILNGLGGKALRCSMPRIRPDWPTRRSRNTWRRWSSAFRSAKNASAPAFPAGRRWSQHELFVEMERFLSVLDLKRTVFRSDHASNWLVLKGTLGADKDRLLQQVRQAIAAPEAANLRPTWARGL
jgi:hypothetical protein